MDDSNDVGDTGNSDKTTRKRGPYLQYLHSNSDNNKIPRSTLYYWKKKENENHVARSQQQQDTHMQVPPGTDNHDSHDVAVVDRVDCNLLDNEEIYDSYDDHHLQEDMHSNHLIGNSDAESNKPGICDMSFSDVENDSSPLSLEHELNAVNTVTNNNVSNEENVSILNGLTVAATGGLDEDDDDPALQPNSTEELVKDPYFEVLIDSEDCDNDNDDEEDNDQEINEILFNTFDSISGSCDDEADKPIYEGSRLSVSVSIMLILTFIMRHHLTGTAVEDLIALVEAHMIAPNLCRKTMKLIRRFIAKLRGKAAFHYYCDKCFTYMGTEHNEVCSVCKTKSKKNSYFLVVPLLTNLESLFKYKGFLNNLKYPVSRTKKCNQHIEDIIDGKVYKKNFGSDGFLRGTSQAAKKKEIHISLQCNTDGVKLFKSSKMDLWPVYYTINELHPSLRYQRKYRLFCGLWFSKNKPDFKTFFHPFARELQEFGSEGKAIQTEEGEKLIKVHLLSGIFDAPAKSMFQNINQFNGNYGCSYCLEAGQTCKTSAHGHTHVFPFNFANKSGHGADRTHKEVVKHAKEAQKVLNETGKITPVCGIKGMSWALAIPRFDIVNGLGIDYLHNTLLGVVKMLIKLWFNKAYKKLPWFIGDKVKDVDTRIKQLTLPNLISRVPRNIESDLSYFKGSEFRSFLLFYSVPILYDFLPDEYFQHYILLVEAIFLLLQDSISIDHLQSSERILKHFCLKIERLYGQRYQTYNVHNLLHLSRSVSNLGPLWCQSAFWYEDYNGDYKHLFHGTQNVNIQIVTNTILQHKIPEMVRNLTPGSLAHALYNRMTVKYHQKVQKLGETIVPGIYSVGNLRNVEICSSVSPLLNHLYHPIKHALTFQRLCFHGLIIQSKSYKRVIKRNTYTIKFNGRFGISFGFVSYFLNLDSGKYPDNPQYLAVVNVPKVLDTKISNNQDATLEHIIPISLVDMTIDVINIKDIIDICCFTGNGVGNDYIVLFPNRIEND